MMRICKNKLIGFTLAELLVVFFIIGVVASATYAISKCQMDIAKKYQYYATFNNLNKVVVELLADATTTTTPDPSTRKDLLPSKAHYQYTVTPFNWIGICDKTSMLVNTIGDINCSLTKSSGTFSKNEANFITTNGARYFNFGLDPVLNVDDPVDPTKDYYEVFVDIDGAFGSGTLNDDVMKFKIYRAGQVIPAVDSTAGMSKKYMSASVKYNNGASEVWLNKGVPYLEAACHAGKVKGGDCPGGLGLQSPCSITTPLPAGEFACEVVINKP